MTIWKASISVVVSVVIGMAVMTTSGWAVAIGLSGLLLAMLIWFPDPLLFAAWLRARARTPGDCVWAFYNAAGDLLGAASLVKQDRELLALPGGWVIAWVNVVRQRRGQGFGRAIMAWLEDELTRRAAERGRPVPVRLQTDNPIAVRLYTSLGFSPLPGKKDIFTKLVTAQPLGRRSRL